MSAVRGIIAEIRAVPMSLMLLTCFLGAVFGAMSMPTKIIIPVLLNAFLFLFVAHLNDTFFDLKREEYERERKLHQVRKNDEAYLARWGFGTEIKNAPLLRASQYLSAVLICSLIGLCVMVYVSLQIGFFYALLAIVGLVLALTYSAGLDKVPALGDTTWEIGVLFALFCGYYSQTLTVDMNIIMFSLPLFIALIGVKMLDGWYDVLIDKKINKITLPVFLSSYMHIEYIRDIGYGFIYLALILLALIAPLLLVGVLSALSVIVVSHLALRCRDMEIRLGIVFMGMGIVVLILYAIEKLLVL